MSAVTSGVDIIIATYRLLTEAEQDEAFERIRGQRVAAAVSQETEMGKYLRSLARVAEVVGGAPTVTDYQAVQPRLRAAGEDIEPFNRLYRFYGSWPRAREALELSTSDTTGTIERRFRSRRLGKVWRYTDAELASALAKATEHWGRPPSVAEFEWWRERELELARARGEEDTHLPSTGPYRSRWLTWEKALLHHGYGTEEVESRLEGKRQPPTPEKDPYLPAGLPHAELGMGPREGLPLTVEEVERLRAAWEALPKRTRYVLTMRLGLGVEAVSLHATAEPIGLHLASVRRIQLQALDALAGAAAGPGRAADMEGYREAVTEALRGLTVRSAP